MHKIKKQSWIKDKADGTLILVLFSLPMMVMVMTLILGIAQINADKNELNSLVQNAAQAGVQKVNADGSINKESMNEVLRTFYRETKYNKSNTNIMTNDRLCKGPITLEGHETPYHNSQTYLLQISIDEQRGNEGEKSKTLIFTPPTSETITDNQQLNLDPDKRYQVLNVVAYVNVKSYWPFLGTDPCRTHKINVSAVTFGSSGDVDYENDFGDEALRGFDWTQEEQWNN